MTKKKHKAAPMSKKEIKLVLKESERIMDILIAQEDKIGLAILASVLGSYLYNFQGSRELLDKLSGCVKKSFEEWAAEES